MRESNPGFDRRCSALRWALMGDVPAVLDSIWRRVEFNMYRPGKFVCDDSRPLGERLPYKWRNPAHSMVFTLFALLSVFVIIGPTLNTFCGLGGPWALTAIKIAISCVALCVGVILSVRFYRASKERLAWRFRKEGPVYERVRDTDVLDTSDINFRKHVAVAGLWLVGVAATFPMLILIYGLLATTSWQAQCNASSGWVASVVMQLLLILVLPPMASYVFMRYRNSNKPEADYRFASERCLIWLVILWALTIAALAPWALNANAIEAIPGPYLQAAWVVMTALLLIVLLARALVTKRISSLPALKITDLRKAVACATLLNVLEDESAPPKGRGYAAFITGVGVRPLQVLLLPAFFAISTPRSWMWTLVIIGLVLSALASMYGSLRERWHQVVSGIERWFFVGLPLPISVLVIVLGILRLANEQYVSTILESAPIGTIFTGVWIAYLTAWFFEVWVNRWLAEALMKYLGASEKEMALGAMAIDGSGHENDTWRVAKPFVLYVHGPGRFGVEGWQEKLAGGKLLREERFANYTFVDLIITVLKDARTPEEREENRSFIDEVRRQVRVYFYSLNAIVAAAAVALWLWHSHVTKPEYISPLINAAEPVRENDLLASKLIGSTEPALIVAASGGGTRAALYTAYALQGLNTLGQARNVVLISGVSGGGAAAAAFVNRFDKLTSEVQDTADGKIVDAKATVEPSNPWDAYRHDLTEPFINDVLDGVNELRIFGKASLGSLLAESMDRRLFRDAKFSSLRPDAPALILNSTISGHPAKDSQLLEMRAAWQTGNQDSAMPCQSEPHPFGSLAGGRMVYTTLGSSSFAMPNVSDAPDVRLDFKVVNDPATSLAAASALNANFPPVFPNARVNIAHAPDQCGDGSDAYFVTDGGATENLGLISALVALNNTLQTLPVDSWATLRPLHVIAIEASAVDYEYSQDRGIGAATGGSKERIAGGLTQMLIDRINESLVDHQRPKLQVTFLPLPMAFRSRGGFGTHWMYARTINVTNPLRVAIPWWQHLPVAHACGDDPCQVELSQDDIATLWSGLFSKELGFCSTPLASAKPDALIVQRWLCGGRLAGGQTTDQHAADGKPVGLPDWQVEQWQKLVASFGAVK